MRGRILRAFWLTTKLVIIGVLLPTISFTAADEPQQGPQYVAALVRNLGADEYHLRIRADEKLAQLGAAARQELEKGATDANPELRLRAKELLRRIHVEDLWKAGSFSYQAPGGPASQVIEALTKQTGNHVLLGDQYGNFDDKPLAAQYSGSDFWPTLDDLCRRTGNRLRPHFDPREPGLVISVGKPGDFPTAYAGPVRAQILSARRAFSEELDYETARSDKTHTFQMNLQMAWEDRFRLIAYRSQAELVSAITDVGTQVASTQPTSAGWNVAGGGARQLAMTLRLQPPPTSATKLDSLTLKWGLVAVGDMATLEIDELTVKSPHYQDDVELRVEAVEQGPGQRCEITLLVLRDLVLEDPQEAFFQECEVELLDQTGAAYRRQGQTNAYEAEGARMKLIFVGEDSASKPTRLKFTYPRIRSQRDVLVTFRNVPLPCGKPE